MLLLFFALGIPPALPSSPNLCSNAHLCCSHRDSGCVVQRVFANHSVDTSQLPCYCDQACQTLDDCCVDYREYCEVRDCVVSEFGPWSPCPMPGDADDPCLGGDDAKEAWTERRRVVLHQSVNGGAECPQLAQRKRCTCEDEAEDREEEGGSKNEEEEEVEHHPDRDEEDQDWLGDHHDKDSASSPRLHHLTSSGEDHSSAASCSEMVILRALKSCRRQDDRLHTGTRICVECHDPDACPGVVVPREEQNENDDKDSHYYLHRRDPTGVMRRFSLGRHCRGRAAVIQAGCGDACAVDGLKFKVVK